MPDYENIIGSTSAAVLGFVHGNVKGAYIGYNLYQKYRNMPNAYQLHRARTDSRATVMKKQKQYTKAVAVYLPPTPHSTGGRRQSRAPKRKLEGTYGRSASVSSSSKARARSVGTTRKTSGGNNNLNNAIKGKRRGRIATRHRVSVPVPKRLRKQIKTVMEDKGVQGKRVQLFNDNFTMGPALPVTTRKFKFVHEQHTTFAQVFFTPLQIMDNASVLFNNKAPGLDYSIETGNFGINAVAPFFETDDMIFDITRQSVEYLFKNNSQRHYEFTITCMTPKENTDQVAQDTITDAITVDTTSGQWNGTPTIGPSKENPANVWQDSPTLKKYYKMEKTTIRMDPGANSSWRMNGFTGRFNYKKYIKQDQTSPNERWLYPKNETKFVVFDCIPNLVGITSAGSGNSAGRWLATAGTIGAPILMECKTTIEMHAPKIKPVDNQRNIKFFENWTTSVPTDGRTIGTRDMDDEGVVLYIPQNS